MDSLGFLEAYPKGVLCKKIEKKNDKIIFKKIAFPKQYNYESLQFETLSDLADFLRSIRFETSLSLVLGKPRSENPIERKANIFKDAQLRWLILDIDHVKAHYSNPDILVTEILPTYFHKISYIAHLTASYGIQQEFSYRLFFHLDKSLSLESQKNVAKFLNCKNIDQKIYQPERLIYTADPIGNGVPDIDERVLLYEKKHEYVNTSILYQHIGAPVNLDKELEKVYNKIKNTEKSKRNDTLYKQGLALVNLWIQKNKDPIELHDPLKTAALKCGLGEDETVATLKSLFETAKNTKVTIADQFYNMAELEIANRIYSDQGESFIQCNTNDVIKIEKAGANRDIKNWLTFLFKQNRHRVPSISVLNAVINQIQADVSREEPQTVYRRIAPDKDLLLIALDKKLNTINISHDNYNIEQGHPDNAFFVEVSRMGALPKPKKHDLELATLIKSLFGNLTDEQSILISAWLIGCWEPNIKYPLLTLSGIRGTGKSTLASALKYFVDPASGNMDSQLASMPDSTRDLYVVLNSQHVTVLDNVSFLSNEFSDALAMAATGGSDKKRALFTDSGVEDLRIRKPVIITSINNVAKNSDLADRSINIDLEPFKRSIDERSLYRDVEEIRPYIMHCIAESLSWSKSHLDAVKSSNLHRMSGWTRTVIAACEGGILGFDSFAFEAAIKTNKDAVTGDILESDSVAAEIINFINTRHTWEGTLKELDDILTLPMTRVPKDWPTKPAWLGRRLKMIVPDMARIKGIYIKKQKTSYGNYYLITDDKRDLYKKTSKNVLIDANRKK